MTTISVPLNEELLKSVKKLVQLGAAPNTAELVRQALQKYIEEKAVEAVLSASKEPSLEGDLEELALQL